MCGSRRRTSSSRQARPLPTELEPEPRSRSGEAMPMQPESRPASDQPPSAACRTRRGRSPPKRASRAGLLLDELDELADVLEARDVPRRELDLEMLLDRDDEIDIRE